MQRLARIRRARSRNDACAARFALGRIAPAFAPETTASGRSRPRGVGRPRRPGRCASFERSSHHSRQSHLDARYGPALGGRFGGCFGIPLGWPGAAVEPDGLIASISYSLAGAGVLAGAPLSKTASQSSRAVNCIVTNNVMIHPMVIANPLNPALNSASEKSTR
jgi:hypothetical protein